MANKNGFTPESISEEKARSILQLLYDLKARQVYEETGVELEVTVSVKKKEATA